MMQSLRVAWFMAAALIIPGCESPRTAESQAPATADTTAQAAVPAVPLAPDTTDVSQTVRHFAEGRDTTFFVGRQSYRLLLRADVDSTKPLLAESAGVVGSAFAADSGSFQRKPEVSGYDGGHTIALLDAQGRRVFRRRLRKADFFAVADRDVVTVSDPQRPVFLGYHAPSQTLAFSLGIGIPQSDVGQEYTIVLGFDGRVRYLGATHTSGLEPDCAPRLLPDGTVLTCQELLRPDGRRVSLLKPKAQLVAAFMLTDTTLCAMYEYGEYRDAVAEDQAANDDQTSPDLQPVTGPVSADFYNPEWVPDPRMRNVPNAFIINIHGQVRQRFRFKDVFELMMYYVPRRYVWQTHSYYLPDEERGIYVLDKHKPAALTRLGFRQMQPFRKPRRPGEVRFELAAAASRYAFYVDPARPTRLRYERIGLPNF